MAGMREKMERRMGEAVQLTHLELVDETSMHNVPPDSESHWKMLVVSADFEGERSVRRHRRVYAALAEELRGAIHALSLVALTPEEWVARRGDSLPESPPCLGGSKQES